MKINSIDAVYFGVDDLEASVKFFSDLGLDQISLANNRAEFETLDGSKVYVCLSDDPLLPPHWSEGPCLRMVRWKVEDQQSIDELKANLSQDRDVRLEDGVLYSQDDTGVGIAFVIGQKPAPPGPAPASNTPGQFQRPVNTRGLSDPNIKPWSVAHVVFNSADYKKSISFYVDRLNFLVSDSFKDSGSFIRAEGASEHHTMFIVNRPPNALNHVAFYVRDLQEVILMGKQMKEAGWSSKWGPGRHILGSNFFWYFDSPVGGGIEATCDPDHVDENWVPSEMELKPENTSMWTLTDFIN